MPLLGAAALACWGSSRAFSALSTGRLSRTYTEAAPTLGGRLTQYREQSRTRMAARGGAEAEADAIEVSGFAGFIVGLALLPHVVYSLTVAFGVAVSGASFALGPYGLQLISCLTSVGVTVWSLGSFIDRGRGLPAGPLGVLGLAEGLSYLATLGLAVAVLITGTKTGSMKLPEVAAPTMPKISAPANFKAPEVKVPDFKAPEIKVPDFKAPEVKIPEFKAPDIKVPEIKAPAFKVPDVKVPEIKVPAIKVPEVKVPEIKVPEVKAPEVKAPAKKEPEKAPEKEPEKKAVKAPTKPAESLPDYDSLFD